METEMSWNALKASTRLLTQLEIEEDKRELRQLGCTEEEIEGYLEFYLDNYLKDLADEYICT